MATKIKKILDASPRDTLFFSSWLDRNGIDRKEQTLYVRSEWLERIAQGVYKLAGSTPSLYGAVASYNLQLGKHCHVGAASALELRGYSHFLTMGKPQAYLFTDKDNRLPSWLVGGEWDRTVKYFTTSVFPAGTGVESIDNDGYQLLLSSPERAFLESLLLSPEYFGLMDTYYLMEMLTALRPALVQELLEKCTSIKVKRLFLYMAEKSGHSWFRALDISRISLGSGKRVIGDSGRFVGKYQITIPSELANYE